MTKKSFWLGILVGLWYCLIAAVLGIAIATVLTTDLKAYGGSASALPTGGSYENTKCSSYFDGYKDGWCSTEYSLSCLGPSVYPYCVDSRFTSVAQAYRIGFDEGRDAR